jgi:hypothetical protein
VVTKSAKPFKTDRLFQRRAVLENLLRTLRYERDHQVGEVRLQLSRDGYQLLVEGIEAALSGTRNPFGIASASNEKQKLLPWARKEAIAEFAALIAGEQATTWDDALTQLGEKFRVERKTIEDAYLRAKSDIQAQNEVAKLWAESNKRVHGGNDPPK